jgi:hypothetical protein
MTPARAHSRGVRPSLTRASHALTFAISSAFPCSAWSATV